MATVLTSPDRAGDILIASTHPCHVLHAGICAEISSVAFSPSESTATSSRPQPLSPCRLTVPAASLSRSAPGVWSGPAISLIRLDHIADLACRFGQALHPC